MKTRLIAAAAATLFCLPALAKDFVDKVEMTFAVDTNVLFHVDGDGDGKGFEYDKVKESTITFTPSVRASCASDAHVTNFIVLATKDPQNGSVIESTGDQYPKVDGFHGSGRPMAWVQLKLNAPVDKLFQHVKGRSADELIAGACNAELASKLYKGGDKEKILEKGFTTKIGHPFTFRAFCAKNSNDDKFSAESLVVERPITVVCNPVKSTGPKRQGRDG